MYGMGVLRVKSNVLGRICTVFEFQYVSRIHRPTRDWPVRVAVGGRVRPAGPRAPTRALRGALRRLPLHGRVQHQRHPVLRPAHAHLHARQAPPAGVLRQKGEQRYSGRSCVCGFKLKFFNPGEDVEDAPVHGAAGPRPVPALAGQVHAGLARLPLLRPVHDPLQDGAQLLLHSTGAQRSEYFKFRNTFLLLLTDDAFQYSLIIYFTCRYEEINHDPSLT